MAFQAASRRRGILSLSGFVAIVVLPCLLTLGGSGKETAGAQKKGAQKKGAQKKYLRTRVYQSGFEETDKFKSGGLVGQSEWFAYKDMYAEALTVSAERAKSGSRSLKLDGSKVGVHPFGTVGGFYGRRLDYNPLKNGTPLVELSADVNLTQAMADNGQCGGGIALILDGGILFGVGKIDTVNFFLMNNSGADVRGPLYKVGEWANIRAVFDFEKKTVTGFFNDRFIATIPFEKGHPDKVTAVGVVMVAKPDKTGKKFKDLTGVISYVDNLTITAFARPGRAEARPMRGQAMMRIPGGTFEMGMHNDPSRAQVELHSHAPDPDELPIHPVSLNSFYMGVYQVTNWQYADALNWALREGLVRVSEGVVLSARGREAYCATTTSSPLSLISWDGNKFKVVGEELPSNDLHNRTLHPVISVSWFGAAAYCNWRSVQEGLQPAYDPATWEVDFAANGYRLPTEAEREYAARGGQKPYVMFPWGNSIEGGHANYNRSGDPWESLIPETTPVGYFDGNQKPPGPDMRNGYGLYDMAGNSFEWCHDWYDATYYSKSPKDNPRGPATGVGRSLRNGSWNCHCLANLRSANRLSANPGNTSFAFRVVTNDRP